MNRRPGNPQDAFSPDPHRAPWEPPPYNPQPSAYIPPSVEEASSGFHEGQREFAHQLVNDHWDKLATERWGDADIITLNTPGSLVGFTRIIATKQLVRAHAPKPCTWKLQFNTGTILDGNVVPAAEVGPLFLDFNITLGSGQSRTTIIQRITLTAALGFNTDPAIVPPFLELPAEDIQVVAQLRGFTVPNALYQIQAACMAAPFGIKF